MSRTLLLADDNPTTRRVVELTFAAEDVRLVAVGDGEQAIQRIPLECPDVILASIGTARRSGYDVALFVKAQPAPAQVPVLLLASAFEPVDEERARRVGAAGVIDKPFDPKQLAARVRELLAAGRPVERRSGAGDAVARPVAVPIVSSETVPDDPSRVRSPESWIPSAEPRVPDPLVRTASPGPAPTIPERTEPTPAQSGSLDDYFERLDTALTARSAGRGPLEILPTPAAGDAGAAAGVPSLDDVLRPEAREPAALEVSDELVDRIADRVLERLRKGQSEA